LKISEELIREITYKVINDLGAEATHDKVREGVEKELAAIQTVPGNPEKFEGKVLVTSFGLNKPGIVARITGTLAEMDIDLQDITQRIMQDFYTLIMIIDITSSPKNLKEIQEALQKVADELNIKIYVQHEDIFRYMFRI